MQRNYEYLQSTNPDLASDYLAAQTRNPDDAFVTVNIPGRGTYAGPQSGLPGFVGGAQQEEYDELPEGYTIRSGGSGGNVAGGFPGRR
jgi:hypothetical protein